MKKTSTALTILISTLAVTLIVQAEISSSSFAEANVPIEPEALAVTVTILSPINDENISSESHQLNFTVSDIPVEQLKSLGYPLLDYVPKQFSGFAVLSFDNHKNFVKYPISYTFPDNKILNYCFSINLKNLTQGQHKLFLKVWFASPSSDHSISLCGNAVPINIDVQTAITPATQSTHAPITLRLDEGILQTIVVVGAFLVVVAVCILVYFHGRQGPVVRISAPFLVTRTVSSMRTPPRPGT